ncbi:MAG: F0F1 ATP synthase subunit gamma [Spirochaetota bacterium]
MPSLEEIQRTIGATDSLKSVIRTMKIMAAVSLRQYERTLYSLADHARTIEDALSVIVKFLPVNTRYFRTKFDVSKRTAVVLFGSDLGMCGQFNDDIAAYCVRTLAGMGIRAENSLMITIGEKIVPRIEGNGFPIAETIPYPAGLQTGITPILHDFILLLERLHDGGIQNVLLFHNRPVGELAYASHMRTLLPIDPEYLLSLRGRKWRSKSIPAIAGDTHMLLREAIRHHLYASLFRAFVDSLAGENAARLMAMQAAEKHVDEHLDELRGRYNAVRQEAITSELLDIIAGFETLTASAPGS